MIVKRKGNEYVVLRSIRKIILAKIKENSQGCVFSAHDFLQEFTRMEVDDALSTLTEEGEIRRIMRGIYDYPVFNDILKTYEAPNIDKIANAIARKFSWKIYLSGSDVLRKWGLLKYAASLECNVPAVDDSDHHIYLSNGPNKKYYIENKCIEFKHISRKESIPEFPHTAEVIQAIKTVGKNNITNEFLIKLAEKYTFTEWKQIKTDASNTTGWIYKIIKEMCKKILQV